MQYTIVNDNYIEDLEKLVNEKIQEGWKPIGGIAINSYDDINGHGCYWVAQAMIKEQPCQNS